MQKEVPNSALPRRVRKIRWIYILLALLMGAWGVHNFYAGYDKKGKWTLGAGIIGLLFIVPIVVTAIMALIDIFTVTEDAHGVPFD